MKDVLKKYILICGASVTELSEKSGVSLSTLSRYMNGARIPDADGDHIKKLARGIYLLLCEKGDRSSGTEEEILDSLQECAREEKQEPDYEGTRDKLRNVLLQLGISVNRLADGTFYSVSSISRFMSGTSKPRDLEQFVDHISKFITKDAEDSGKTGELRKMLEESTKTEPEDSEICDVLRAWLLGQYSGNSNQSSQELLTKIDEFNYEAYMANVDMSAIEGIPVTKRKLPVTKRFHGQKGMETGIMDFFKATVTSSSKEPLFIYSDHPIEHRADDRETLDRWKQAAGVAVLQGRELHVLHDVRRPIEEIVLGLESWLPLYMTGRVRSYYIEQAAESPFKHILMVSGSAALSGYSVSGIMTESNYVFTKSIPKIAESRKAANALIMQSRVLAEAYDGSMSKEYRKFLLEDSDEVGDRVTYSETPPICTISEELLEDILDNNNVTGQSREVILQYAKEEKERISKILKHSKVKEIIKEKKDASDHIENINLLLDGCSERLEIKYNEEQYLEHIRLTEEFAKEEPNYILVTTSETKVSHTRIVARKDGTIVVSRNTGREFHISINYPKLVNSIYTMLDRI
ncbi:MAG: helix-turn-helix transcriptional regulator [Firmicutes bacterium]|nr:helix-turn-helix transcriptional regulator [Bacillota bacterium]